MAEAKNPPLVGLRERRIFRCITQQELADIIGTTQSHYRQFEAGGVRLDVYRAKLLATRLECTIDQLL